MAKLLLRGETFDLVSPSAQYEADYESLIFSHRHALYPHAHLVRFKCPVDSEYGTAVPDLALIDKAYRAWWVVEVELAGHSLTGHVLPQVSVFATGVYGERHAEYLTAQSADLDSAAIHDMIRGAPPRVLVLANRFDVEWARALREWDARLGVVEVFRSDRSVEVLRINGDHPEMAEEVVSICRRDRSLAMSLVVESPAALPAADGDQLSLWYDGGITKWKRMATKERVWLMPIGRCPLSIESSVFHLLRDANGDLHLRHARATQSRRL